MYKLTLLIIVLTFLACGKKNAVNRTTALIGNGRGSAGVDEFQYSIDGGLPKYLTSDYQFANSQAVVIDPGNSTQTTAAAKPAATETTNAPVPAAPANAPVTANVVHYVQIRVALAKSPKTAQDTTTTTAAVVAKPQGAGTKVIPPTPAKPVKHTYEYFYEEIITCSDANISKGTIIRHADLPGEGTISKASPLRILGGGTLTIIPSSTSRNRTKTPAYASLGLEKAVGSATTVNLTMRHSSFMTKEKLADLHSKLLPFTDKSVEKAVQDYAKTYCINVQGTPPRSIKPDDIQEQEPNVTPSSVANDLYNMGPNVEDESSQTQVRD